MKRFSGTIIAVSTMTALVALLVIALLSFSSQNAQARKQLNVASKTLSISQQTLKALTAAIDGQSQTEKDAILAIVNDNRRTNGCSVLTDFSQLADAPACKVAPTVVTVPGPTVTVPVPAPDPAVPSTTVAPTTTTTIPKNNGQAKKNCKLNLLGICIAS